MVKSRLVMQSESSPRDFTIVERYAHESSQKYVRLSISLEVGEANEHEGTILRTHIGRYENVNIRFHDKYCDLRFTDLRRLRQTTPRPTNGPAPLQRTRHQQGSARRAGLGDVGGSEEAPKLSQESFYDFQGRLKVEINAVCRCTKQKFSQNKAMILMPFTIHKPLRTKVKVMVICCE